MLNRLKEWFRKPAPAKQIDIAPPMAVEGADDILAFIVRDCFANGDAAYEVGEDGTLRRLNLNKNSEG